MIQRTLAVLVAIGAMWEAGRRHGRMRRIPFDHGHQTLRQRQLDATVQIIANTDVLGDFGA